MRAKTVFSSHIIFVLALILSILSPFEATHAAGLTQEESEYIEAFTPIAEKAQQQGIAIRVAIVGDASRKLSRIFMTFKDGKCVLGLNLRSNASFDPLNVEMLGVDRAQMLNAVLAHEMGHCFAMTAGAVTQLLVTQDTHADEVRADLFALAWVAVYTPQDFLPTMRYLKTLRGYLLKQNNQGYEGASPEELLPAQEFRKTAQEDMLMRVATGR